MLSCSLKLIELESSSEEEIPRPPPPKRPRAQHRPSSPPKGPKAQSGSRPKPRPRQRNEDYHHVEVLPPPSNDPVERMQDEISLAENLPLKAPGMKRRRTWKEMVQRLLMALPHPNPKPNQCVTLESLSQLNILQQYRKLCIVRSVSSVAICRF